jgi:hypothetical protein
MEEKTEYQTSQLEPKGLLSLTTVLQARSLPVNHLFLLQKCLLSSISLPLWRWDLSLNHLATLWVSYFVCSHIHVHVNKFMSLFSVNLSMPVYLSRCNYQTFRGKAWTSLCYWRTTQMENPDNEEVIHMCVYQVLGNSCAFTQFWHEPNCF